MWHIERKDFSYPHKFSSLSCSKPVNQESDILTLALKYYAGDKIEFFVTVTTKKLAILKTKFRSITSSTASQQVWDNHIISFNIEASTDFYRFNQVMTILRNEINDFTAIEKAILKLVNAPKKLSLATTELHQKDAAKKIEADVDNNQRSSVFISAKHSENRLRAAYNFPKPNYPNDLGNDIAFDANDPESAAIAAAVKADAIEQYDYAEHDIRKYSAEENELIASLLEKLETIQTTIINAGFLVYRDKDEFEDAEPYLVVSDKTRRLLLAPTAADSQQEIDKAQLALDVMASIRALKPGGSHSHNGAMAQSKIFGYGMRNLVALMYKCYRETFEYDPKEENEHIFMTGVQDTAAFIALARAIANGSRGKERNNDNGPADSLQDEDLRVCDRGRYNALIAGFNGILKEVEIIYEITDLMLLEFKNEIIERLLQRAEVQTLDIAQTYLDIWLGKNANKQFMRYQAFENKVKADFPQMLSRFLHKVCGHSETLKNSLSAELKHEIKAAEEHGLGLSYIETVSPSSELLAAQWQRLHPPQQPQQPQPSRKRSRHRFKNGV